MAKGFKHGSGGLPLNFKVVGNPQPSSPKENTIWVNTDTKITSYHFSATQPSTPASGMVWFFATTSSSIQFNALKKDGIQVYPISAKQYINGAWVDKSVSIYQGDKWVAWWSGELYKNGYEYSENTGGWVGKALRGNTSGNDTMPTITRNKDSIVASVPNDGGGVLHTANKIDLTNYKTITFKGTLKGNAAHSAMSLGVWSSFTTYWRQAAAIHTYEGNRTVTDFSLDVSSLSGKYYVGFGVHAASATITEVRCE